MREFWEFGRSWADFLDWNFWEAVQRRGTHVNTPEIGSRGGEI
jgi:hypothetical protein